MSSRQQLIDGDCHPRLVILVVEDNQKQLRDLVKRGNELLRSHFGSTLNARSEFKGVRTSQEAIRIFKEEGDIQAVLMDWYLDEANQKSAIGLEKRAQTLSKGELVAEFKGIRPEVPVYVMTVKKSGYEVVDTAGKIKSYFSKDEIRQNLDHVLNKLMSDFDERMKTPFWDRYGEYVVDARDGWHTPGHSGGTSFQSSPYLRRFYNFFGPNCFLGDLSVSVENLGSLLDSTGPIGQAQERAARTFGVRRTFFATNGSSTSNKIILQTILRPGEEVIVDRNCHKSVHYGVICSGAKPVYLESCFDPGYGIFAPPSPKEIEKKISENKKARVLVLTGCTYDGMLLDLKTVVRMAHDKGLKVFVDEAWFAYSSFHPDFRQYSAIVSGADYITHSAHKVLSAFSQASLIHINDPQFDEDFFRENFYIYTSTSPQYAMIASLDVARMQMEMEGFKRIGAALMLANEFRNRLSNSKTCRVVGPAEFAARFPFYTGDKVGFDPLKVLVDISSSGLSIDEVHRVLQSDGGLEIEKTTGSTFLILFTMGATAAKVTRIYHAVKEIEKLARGRGHDETRSTLPAEIMPPIKCDEPPRNAFYSEKTAVPIDKAEGRIAAGLVTPYPPGIPLWVPGQTITRQHVAYLDNAVNRDKREVHGCHNQYVYVKAGNGEVGS